MEKIDYSKEDQTNYAGFWLRFAAYLIDRAIISVLELIIAIPAVIAIVIFAIGIENVKEIEDFLTDGNLIKVGIIIGVVILLSLFRLVSRWLYYALFESSMHCATLGKIAVGIKVTTCSGERISFGRASGRYFARIITNLTLLVGYIMAGFTERKQALHDVIANCIVVKKE